MITLRIELLSFVFLVTFFGLSSAQWNFPELVNRVSQEKSRVVSYRLTINQTPDIKGSRFAYCTWIEEFATVGNHHVVAIIQRDQKGKATFWGISGRSDDVWIHGSSDRDSVGSVQFDPDIHVQIPTSLDWKIIGLGFCGDIGDRFETVAKNVASWDPDGAATFVQNKDGLKVVFFETRVEAEIGDGLRITKFTKGDTKTASKTFSEWRVEYKKLFSQKLPVAATLQCGEDKVAYELIWEAVNEPLKPGTSCVQRLQEAMQKANVKTVAK